ncbi:hypothetical protein DFS34DRAFT_644263 [Phlyctochytrium arcticum]|nr:hypothetical protein DFS34DRAFT_644263 [Phlyctochytrium arcticum]
MSLFRPPQDDSSLDPLLPAGVPEDTSAEPWDASFRLVHSGLIALVKDLVNQTITVPVKISHMLQSTQKAEEIIKSINARAGKASVFVTLQVCRKFRNDAEEDPINKQLLEARSSYAEVLAILLLAQYVRFDKLKEVLTCQWDDNRGLREPIENGGLQLRRYRALKTVTEQSPSSPDSRSISPSNPLHLRSSNPRNVNKHGSYVYSASLTQGLERRHGRVQAREIVRRRQSRLGTTRRLQFSWWKLKVPRYQYYTSVLIYFIFLALFTVVLNRRTPNIEASEIVLYIFVASFIAEDLKSALLATTTRHSLGMWNTIDYGAYLIFMVSFFYRMWAVHATDHNEKYERIDTAYDIMSCAAVLVWFRTLELLDTFRNFGYLLVTVRRMLGDAFHFFILIAILMLGFTQAFSGLAEQNAGSTDPNPEPKKSLPFIINMLARSLMSDPAYDEAASIHSVFGTILMHIFLFISYLVFMNLLIAVFNNSYDEVRQRSEVEYQLLLAEKILEHIQRSYEVPFLPPANLVEILFLPVFPIMGRDRTRHVLEYVCAILFLPELLLIGIYELVVPPPDVQSHVECIMPNNVAFETWRLDFEDGNSNGGGGLTQQTGDGLEEAHAKAADGDRASVIDGDGAPDMSTVDSKLDRILSILDRLETRVSELEHQQHR